MPNKERKMDMPITVGEDDESAFRGSIKYLKASGSNGSNPKAE